MVKTFTQNEMIMAMYHELSGDNMAELENQLEQNSESEHNFENLNQLKHELNQLLVNPSNVVVESILAYSKSF